MNSRFLTVNRIVTQDDLIKLREAAARDDHYPLYPTHSITKGNEIVGSISAMSIPLMGIWLHTQKMNARSSAEAINIANNIAREKNGGLPIVTLCPRTSPVFPHMTGLGFKFYTDTAIFLGGGGPGKEAR